MQNEDIIRELQSLWTVCPIENHRFLLEAAEILKKELPQVPQENREIAFAYKCPACGRAVCLSIDKPRCRSCGQVLDWKAR